MRLVYFLLFIFIAQTGRTQFCFFPEDTENNFNRSMQLIKPVHANWVKTTAGKLNKGQLEPENLRQEARNYGIAGKLADADIEALLFLVMMQASRDAQEDLRSIMEEIKSINKKKSEMRKAMRELQAGNSIRYNSQLDSIKRTLGLIKFEGKPARAEALKVVGKAEKDALATSIKNELDSMSEMGETESLRLQMAMDRMSKMMSMLSNILKKVASTSETLIQNLK